MSSANCRGVEEDCEKSTWLKETAPEVTSGTSEIVVSVVEQVIEDWIASTESWTSAGRVVLPITKQALAWRGSGAVVGAVIVHVSLLVR